MPQNPFYETDTATTAPSAAASGGNPFYDGGGGGGAEAPPPMTPAASSESSGSGLGMGLGAAALGGLALLAHQNPGTVQKIAKTVGAARMQAMLSGLAPLKSMLGNAGAAVSESIERGSMAPIKEVFSGQTLADARAAWKAGTPAGGTTLSIMGHELPSPGRFMGALDDATQKALVRSGSSVENAQRAVLQTPLGTNFGRFGESLDNPVMDYMMPFRRTPFNQLYEGGNAFTRAANGDRGAQRGLAAYMSAGAVHGAATSDDNTPMSVPLAIAASGKFGLPYGVAALAGRTLMGGSGGGGIAGNVLPVSEYGITQGIQDPLKPFREPAALKAIDKVFGGG